MPAPRWVGAQAPGWVLGGCSPLIPRINTVLSLTFESHDLVWTHGDGTAANVIYCIGFLIGIWFWMGEMSLLRDSSVLV